MPTPASASAPTRCLRVLPAPPLQRALPLHLCTGVASAIRGSLDTPGTREASVSAITQAARQVSAKVGRRKTPPGSSVAVPVKSGGVSNACPA